MNDSVSNGTRRSRWLAWLPAVWAVCCLACSDDGTPTPSTIDPDLEALYVMIREQRHAYERGVERIVAGEEIPGRNILIAASERLSVAATLCGRTPGCDVTVFDEALAQVARQRLSEVTPAVGQPQATTEPTDAQSTVAHDGLSLDALTLRESIPMNQDVLAALNDWLTWNRPALIQTYENYQFLRPSIAPIYREAGLPEALLFAMLAKETGAKVHAYSRAGAVGPLQFMRHTARRYGIRSVAGFDNRLDPVIATRANVKYVLDQLATFDNDLELTLAAYNGGETRARRLHRKLPDADFWDPRLYYAMPSETRDYVPQILAAALLFMNPERYGVEFPPYDSGSTPIVLAEEISIGELTICLGQQGNSRGWFRTLRNLNPRLKPAVRSRAGETIVIPLQLVEPYAERCVGGSDLGRLARRLHDADFPEQPDVVRYTVRRGDTLARIAGRHGCKAVRDLAAINGIEAPEYVIHVGQKLSVPTCS